MTTIRLGYVAMSVNLQNCSPSQTLTYTHFSKIDDPEARLNKLIRIAQSNLHNCLRLLRHNAAHDISFFRLSSRLIPLVTHEDLKGWNYIKPLREHFQQIGDYARQQQMRIDFHPDHFVMLNSPRKEVFKASVKALSVHRNMLRAMGIDLQHRCVIHVGGVYRNKELALERFIEHWGHVPPSIQTMIMLENDDKSFHLEDTLYLCEKLNIPLVFDLHHHLAHHREADWEKHWERVIQTWEHSPLPPKIHFSSPNNDKQFRAHADLIDPEMFLRFLDRIRGSVEHIDCMIEAKMKDQALFELVDQLKKGKEIEWIDQATFRIGHS